MQKLTESLDFFVQDLAQKGVRIKPWGRSSAEKFLSFLPQQQEKICNHFESYARLVRSQGSSDQEISEGDDTCSEKDLLRVCARNLDIQFHPDVYNKLTNEDILEIYDKDLVQMYRNLGFFDLCSYSLLDLLSYEFYDLYERSLQVNSLLMEVGQLLYRRPYSLEPVSLRHIPKHLMREKFSEGKYSFMIEFKEMYPVYTRNRDFYGYLIIQGAARTSDATASLFFI